MNHNDKPRFVFMERVNIVLLCALVGLYCGLVWRWGGIHRAILLMSVAAVAVCAVLAGILFAHRKLYFDGYPFWRAIAKDATAQLLKARTSHPSATFSVQVGVVSSARPPEQQKEYIN